MRLVIYIFAILTLCAPAFGQKMDFDVSIGTDFSKYETYKWQRASDARYPSDDIDQLLIRTIDEQLRLKGLMRVETESADLYVIYQLAITDDMKWSSFQTNLGWVGNPVTGVYSTIPGATTNSSYPVSIGSLFIDIYDVAQKKRVWQVHATETVHPDAKPDKREKNAKKVMEKVFKNYPTPLPKK